VTDPQLLVRLARAYCYAIAPYLCLYLALPHKRGGIAERLVPGLAVANAAFILTATLVCELSFNLYHVAHPAIAAVGVALLLYRWRLSGWAKPEMNTSPSVYIFLGIVLLAFAVRLVPILAGGESLGGGDARFHNLLARKIVVGGKLSEDWTPFADIGVMYPQGTHTFVAFLAVGARCSVHHALNFLFPVVGALTTAVIYVLARALFRSDGAAAWSSACYAFLAAWGSLDLYRWGGLPNGFGMLALCTMLYLLLEHGCSTRTYEESVIPDKACPEPVERTEGSQVPKALAIAILVPSILLTHHYTLIVAGIMLVSVALFTADAKLRGFTLLAAVLAAVLAAPLLFLHYVRFVGGLGETGVLVFREPIRTVLFYAQHMGPGLVAMFACALVLARKAKWNTGQVAVLAWFTGLFAAFVSLEYICRGVVLAATGGADCFSCLTPSRMATDMVYPMSILSGAVVTCNAWKKHAKLWTAGIVVLGIATSGMAVRDQLRVGVFPEYRAAAQWLRRHSRQNAMIVGNLPHLEYLSWRETSAPPLPASEQRNHPSVTWKREMDSFDSWLEWERTNRRPVYFVLPPHERGPASLNELFFNGHVRIISTREPPKAVEPGFRPRR